MKSKKILVAESNDHIRKLTAVTFRNAGFETIEVKNDIEAISRASFSKPDAILIDSLISHDIHNTVKFMKCHPNISRKIPIMVSSSVMSNSFVNGALQAGAMDVIAKPFTRDMLVDKFSTILNTIPYQPESIVPKMPVFLSNIGEKQETSGNVTMAFQRIQYIMKLIKKTFKGAKDLNLEVVKETEQAVAKLAAYIYSGKRLPVINRNHLQDDSDYLFVHTVNKLFFSLMAAYEMGWKEQEARYVGMGALLSDIGFTRVDLNAIKGKTKLTQEERREVERHVEEGANMLSSIGLPEEIVETVAFHHEKIDGTGYPYGLRGEQINKNAKLLAIIDSFDALTTWRKHRPNLSSQEAIRKMHCMSGFFDPQILSDFTKTGLCKEY